MMLIIFSFISLMSTSSEKILGELASKNFISKIWIVIESSFLKKTAEHVKNVINQLNWVGAVHK